MTERDYLPVLLQILKHARRSVDVLAYSFAIGSEGGRLNESGAPLQIARELVKLATGARKVKVRVYLEGERDTASRNGVTAKFLKKSGVKIKFGATHAKGFQIDGRYVLFGSTNLTHQSIAKNNETNLMIDRKDVAEEFGRYFEHLWKGGRQGGIDLDPPMLADGAFKEKLIAMIDGAKKRIDFSIYFFDQAEIEAALVRAKKRGVIITGFIHNHFAFAMSYVRRTRRTAERLKKAGIKNLHYGPVHLFTHSKYLIADRREIALGTGNWLDEDVEIHPQLYIAFKDPKLAASLAKHLAGQIRKRPGRA